MSPLTEYTEVEAPLIAQLKSMGWEYLPGIDPREAQRVGIPTDPAQTERDDFKEVLLKGRLRQAVHRINRDEDGQPWLDDIQVGQMVGELERLGTSSLMEANQAATNLLLEGTTMQRPDRHPETVHFIDFEHPERNDFLVVNQFRVDPPGNRTGGRGSIIPDLVLFVNGIPLVVIECKSPDAAEPLNAAITQLFRYSNQRSSEIPEGVERLFHYNLLMVATHYYQAVVGTVGASYKNYLAWKDPYPLTPDELATELSKERARAQEILAAGLLRPSHLLDVLQNFTLFDAKAGKTVKIVPRYQQYRAVHKVIERLRTDTDTPLERSGIVWHTQGSGKSLTMVFLIRKMRTLPVLKTYKIVVLTDRTDLEKQLAGTATLTKEPVVRATNVDNLKTRLAQQGAGLVFGMVQKFRGDTADEDDGDTSNTSSEVVPFTEPLNTADKILVLVDEAHRSHTNTMHANMRVALPNAALVGFTGTPIVQEDKKKTQAIFGSFIDTYTIRESQLDGATVPIRYEGRTAKGRVDQGGTVDTLFEDFFQDLDDAQREALKRKYATKGNVLEARQLIQAKARDMLRHYVAHVLPNGFKAQLVATSRQACIRYHGALEDAKQELVTELEGLEPSLLARGRGEMEGLEPNNRFLVNAHEHLDTIRRLEFAVVVSGGQNDPKDWETWTSKSRQDARVERFKKPLGDDPLAFLIVKSMLLTGFDAPVEQALYLDRSMKNHELLQAVARVNRTYTPEKTYGLVVDYYGVANHLHEALAVYAEGDIEGAMQPVEDELPVLRDRHERVIQFFAKAGLTLDNVEGCVHFVEDERKRAEFKVLVKQFSESLDAVLPRPEGLPFVKDAKLLGKIQKRAAQLYRDTALVPPDAGEKVRKLIDDHLVSEGIDPKVPPIELLATDFVERVERQPSKQTQAAEMTYAARHHIDTHFDEDPVRYRKLSEMLEHALETHESNWGERVDMLRPIVEELREGPRADDTGLDPILHRPFLSLLEEANDQPSDGAPDPEHLAATLDIVESVKQEISKVDFWRNAVAQENLRNSIANYLDSKDLVPYDALDRIADEMMQIAKKNHGRLVGP